MNIKKLEASLFQLTKSEQYHQGHDPLTLSERYKNIKKINYQDRSMYLFTFNSLFENKYVIVNKESRFTFIPEHIHTVIEFIYVYSGKCTQTIDGKKVFMEQGDICMLDTNVPHSIAYLNEEDIIISIEIRKEYLTQGFLNRLGDNGIINSFLLNSLSSNAKHDQYLLFKKQEDNQIHTIIQNILCEHYEPIFCSDKVIDAYMILLFCEILRKYKNQQMNEKKNKNHLMSILNYIEDHCFTTSLQDTADVFGFTPQYLSSYIKKGTGKSFKELIILQRMCQACFYLSNTEMPIYEIANKVGYDNLGFFYKKFEAIYKMTPQKYRELKYDSLL